MKYNVLVFTLTATLLSLTGCNSDTDSSTSPSDRDPPHGDKPPIITPPPVEIEPIVYEGTLSSSAKTVVGEVYCNGSLIQDGIFFVEEGEQFSCTLGHVNLGNFEAPYRTTYSLSPFTSPSADTSTSIHSDVVPALFDLESLHGNNVTKVLQSISTCNHDSDICLEALNAYDIQEVYNQLDNDEAVDEYLEFMQEKATDAIGSAPSTHVDSSVVPAVDPDADNNLGSGFVSASAELSYTYRPSEEGKVVSSSILTDHNGTPISGIDYYSESKVGKTESDGRFEYKWGETITFGIDSFVLGSFTANQVDYKITDVTDNPLAKSNIQALLERYGQQNGLALEISDTVHEVFAQYQNTINELIVLTLPNGSAIGDSGFVLPNEFEDQFNHGLTADIDEALRQNTYHTQYWHAPLTLDMGDGKYVTQQLKTLFSDVTSFHIFNDNGSFYGATGYTRGMRALNLSNRAYPIMMPRTDSNRRLNFGEDQAWTRDGYPYIASHPDIEIPEIPQVTKDNATFGFPFVTAGELGAGKVVFMGNGLYPSILSCPNNYWANRALKINSSEQNCTADNIENPLHDDQGSMKTFFGNLLTWFNNGESIEGITIGTNIEKAYAARHNSDYGLEYDFFISSDYEIGSLELLTKHGFNHLSVSETPILILQGYPVEVIRDGKTRLFVADLEQPKLSQEDITSLIRYVNDGGNILFMEALSKVNPEPIGRLADAVGVSVGGQNVTPTNQAYCGSSYYCQNPKPNLHVKTRYDMVVLEQILDVDGAQPYTVNQDGTVTWSKEANRLDFEIPRYEIPVLDDSGNPILDDQDQPIMTSKFARIYVEDEQERTAAISELKIAFPDAPVCTHEYEYEFNCIDVRKGDGITVRGNYWRADFDRYQVNDDVIESMIRSANLGSNFSALYEHELYYRTKGEQGLRLSTTILNQTFDNLGLWMWNNNAYRYESSIQDELGFQTAVQFLNCYTGNRHQTDEADALCPTELYSSLINHDMIHSEGELIGQLNPSYPLNYMEKPLTRIMLGRSYWDHNIVVDTTDYPGRTVDHGSNGTVSINTDGRSVNYSAGNRQSTGYWAPQLQTIEISGGVEATITVMMADDLTGRPKHETSLKRPPKMQITRRHDGVRTEIVAPYGGLIYIQPRVRNQGEATFTIDGALPAAWWKQENGLDQGDWVEGHSPNQAQAPIAEIDTGTFIYTTPYQNTTGTDLNHFSIEMNRFADAASDFYGRDETHEGGKHRRFTNAELEGFRHRFVNDIQISIGSAHSGYPVMNTGFKPNSNTIPTNPLNSWLLWHEIGHNLASAPFTASGSGEVTNNILALYMQELDGRNGNPRMDAIIFNIQKAPLWLDMHGGHAWSHADAGMRLVMFGQLKIWATEHFKIDDWYPVGSEPKPSIYGDDEGWNMFKLMHRKARGDIIGDHLDNNYCSSTFTGFKGANLMMVCSSYVSGFDLTDFFETWNVGEESVTHLDGNKSYSGGISNSAVSMVKGLKLATPEKNPLHIDSL